MSDLNDLLGGGELKAPGLGDAVGGSSNKELMAAARLSLSGNWGMGVVGYVLYFLLAMSFSAFVISSVFFVSLVSSASGNDPFQAISTIWNVTLLVLLLVMGAFKVGFRSYYLVIAQEGEARLEMLFTGFRRFWKSFGVYFLYSLFILLWSLLLVIPGIIAAFRYAMAFFIVADDEDCGPLEAISRSKQMMAGNKWKLFCLYWRFFGWSILCFLTGGIGFLWLVPYMQTSFSKFYEDVK